MQGIARHNFREPPPLLIPSSAATWSLTDKNANITVSAAGLTVTSSLANDASGHGEAETTSIDIGVKRIWKLVPVISQGAAGTCATGVCNSSVTFGDNQFFGAQAGGLGWANNGTMVSNNTTVGSGFPSYAQGDTLFMAVEGGNKLWVANGSAPDVTTGGQDISGLGLVYPAYDLGGFAHAGDISTATFAQPLGIILPAGFSVFP